MTVSNHSHPTETVPNNRLICLLQQSCEVYSRNQGGQVDPGNRGNKRE